jgi:hypothetical protein
MSFMRGTIVCALESPGDGAGALAQAWQRDEERLAGYQVPLIHGGVLRQESIARFQKWVDHRPAEGPVWAWAKSLADRD